MRMFGRIGLVFGLFFVIVGAIYGITSKEYEGFPLLLMTAGGFTLLAVWALWMFRRARREADAGGEEAGEPHVGPTIWPLVLSLSAIAFVLGLLAATWLSSRWEDGSRTCDGSGVPTQRRRTRWRGPEVRRRHEEPIRSLHPVRPGGSTRPRGVSRVQPGRSPRPHSHPVPRDHLPVRARGDGHPRGDLAAPSLILWDRMRRSGAGLVPRSALLPRRGGLDRLGRLLHRTLGRWPPPRCCNRRSRRSTGRPRTGSRANDCPR